MERRLRAFVFAVVAGILIAPATARASEATLSKADPALLRALQNDAAAPDAHAAQEITQLFWLAETASACGWGGRCCAMVRGW